MLADWLSPIEVPTFLETILDKQPHAGAATALAAVPLLQWPIVENVLRSDRPLDVLTVKGGQMVEVQCPRSLADIKELMKLGVSVVVRASEQHDPGLAALAAGFADTLSGEVHIQIYATPVGTNSYGWHYDFEDVFIVHQTGGGT